MKAVTRKEALVNAKANGTLDSFKPLTRDEAFTKKALGLGGGASSWNDLTDKPFYIKDGVTILDNTPIVLDGSNSERPFLRNPFIIDIVIGETYIVTWDGVSYTVIAKESEGAITIGNEYIAGFGSDTGEPFFIGVGEDGGEKWSMLFCDYGEHTVKIIKGSVKTIDNCYLPKAQMGYDEVRPIPGIVVLGSDTFALKHFVIEPGVTTFGDFIQAFENEQMTEVKWIIEHRGTGVSYELLSRATTNRNGWRHIALEVSNTYGEKWVLIHKFDDYDSAFGEVIDGGACLLHSDPYPFVLLVDENGNLSSKCVTDF